MNKHECKRKVELLEFQLNEKTKELEYQKGEYSRLKTAYEMSKKLIRELKQGE
jgi:hypothetical protein